MKKEDVKIGMKVVPFQKTAWTPNLDMSYEYNKAIENNQKFLYVNSWDEEENAFLLNSKELVGADGDFFNPEDFDLYTEN